MRYILLLVLFLTTAHGATLPTKEEWCSFHLTETCTQEMYDTFIAEETRKEDFRNRLKAIPDLRMAMVKANLDQPNSALLERDIIEKNELNKLLALEATVQSINSDLQKQAIKEQYKKRKSFVSEIEAEFFIRNVGKTKRQCKDWEKETDPIFKLFSKGMFETALDEVNLLTASVALSQSDIDYFKAELTKYLGL
jgi:hypothetical protein